MGPMPSPAVTVLITAYNAEATLRRAIDSVYVQDFDDLEIVIVDDGSLDGTSAVAASYDRPEIRLFSLTKNVGVCAALNHGLAQARGRYVAFLDADDEWLPGKLKRQFDVLEANPRATFVSCGCVFVAPNGVAFREFGERPTGLAKNEIWRALLATTWVAKPCVVARTDALRTAGGFNVALAVAEDQDMWIRLAIAGEVEFITDILVRCHDTPNSLTKVYANRAADFVLPVVRKYIAQMKSEISTAEIRKALGERYSTIGRGLYINGSLIRGAQFLAQSVLCGVRKRENLWYLVTAAPPVRFMKRAARLPDTPPPSVAVIRPPGDLFAPTEADLVDLPPGPPLLTVVVDTEAEFDWSKPFARDLTKVRNLQRQEPTQRLFERYRVRPAYMVDYAVATQADGYKPIRDFFTSGQCEVGAHLQPWENPPFEEELSERNSFVGNLPGWLHLEKLRQLTDAIEANFGSRPRSHKAGRYGVGRGTPGILSALGYTIDLSALPSTDLSGHGGPNFRAAPPQPYWFGPDRQLLELPMTVAEIGTLARFRRIVSPAIRRSMMLRLRAPGVFARLGLLERITLTPEGITLEEMKRLTRSLLAEGGRTFTLSYHSSTLLPGSTPYVSSQTDLDAFIDKIARFLEFFLGELGGSAITPSEFHAMASARRASANDDALHQQRKRA